MLLGAQRADGGFTTDRREQVAGFCVAPEVSVGLASQDSRDADGSSAQVSGSSTFQGNPLLPPAARLVPFPVLEAGAGLSLGVAGERSGPGGIWVRGQSCRWGSPGLWSPLALSSGPNSALVTCLQLSPWEANLKQRLCAGSRAGCEFRGRTCWGEGWAAGRHRSGPQPIACGGALS